MFKKIVFILVGGICLFGSTIVSAQTKDANEVGATEGVLLPAPSITESDDASSIAVNPANLAFLQSWNLMYIGAWIQNQERITGQGHGFFFGIPLGPLGFGISVEPLMPPTEVVEWQGIGNRTRFSLSLAADFKRIVSFGIAYRTFWFSDFSQIHTMDLALSVRPSNYLALSFVFSDVNAPSFEYRYWMEDQDRWSSVHNHRAPRRFNVGLTIRPLATDRLAVGAELRYYNGFADDQMDTGGSSFSRTDVMAFLSGRPVNGLSLKLRFTAEDLGTANETNMILDGSIGLDLPNFGIGAGFVGQVSPSGAAEYQGTSWYAALHGDLAPSLPFRRPIRSAHVAVADIENPLDSYGFCDLTASFERMENDVGVDMLLLRPDAEVFSLSQAEEISASVKRLQKAGKIVICYLTEASSAEYLACSGADRVWINPAGGIRMSGVSISTFYFGDIAKKVGVNADMVRIGEYKSAPETYTENAPGDKTVEQTNQYLDDVYATMISMVQKTRGFKTQEAARQVIEKGPFTANEAIAEHLADEVIPKDMLEAKLFDMVGNHVFFDMEYAKDNVRRIRYFDSPAIAVVHIDGDLIDGENMDIPIINMKMTGAKTITEMLRQIGGDNRIRAVVVRIDSPGGSAMASDIIWREIAALRREKPVVVSMGSLAASGGYYIASAANKIYADAVTLTGSIGIYYGKADLSGLLSKIGVSPVTFKRGESADIQSWTRPYTDKEREQLKRQIAQFYNLFLQRVAEGRANGLTPGRIDTVGRGRIWSGTDAKFHLLADEIGGYADAVKYARSLVGSKVDIPLLHYPKKPKSMLFRLLSSASAMVRQPDPFSAIFESSGFVRIARSLAPFAVVDPLAPRARLPFAMVEE
jgi:protease-4